MQKVVVGKDFDLSGTGYAYSFKKIYDIIIETFSVQSEGKVST